MEPKSLYSLLECSLLSPLRSLSAIFFHPSPSINMFLVLTIIHPPLLCNIVCMFFPFNSEFFFYSFCFSCVLDAVIRKLALYYLLDYLWCELYLSIQYVLFLFLMIFYNNLINSLHYAKLSFTRFFSRSFLMPYVPLSILDKMSTYSDFNCIS